MLPSSAPWVSCIMDCMQIKASVRSYVRGLAGEAIWNLAPTVVEDQAEGKWDVKVYSENVGSYRRAQTHRRL